MRVIGLIPSRLGSTRLPAKSLLEIDGLPLVVHTMKRAQLATSLDEVYVCTDSKSIADVVKKHGGKHIMTSVDHRNGTERIAEAANGMEADLFLDIQGDEPLINPDHIDAVIAEHQHHPEWDIILPSLPIDKPETQHICKVVHDVNYRILYLSRAVIPQPFKHRPDYYLKHLSIISFKPDALRRYSTLEPSALEQAESIELLRAIENGMIIGTVLLEGDSFSVDIKQDFDKAVEQMAIDETRKRY
jgi:3-deoxy-manno-octulosonate cytidylyltransferase (CMP-KDO synthetase)|tara:strand:- start:618 stop:1352 length:735 start_codon:yes stop_codon:yes gene_type:complete